MLPYTQSGFCSFHSTETSLLKIYEDSLLSCDKGYISLFLCLDFSSAFDTVDHSLLIQQLKTFFGSSGSCLKWIFFYRFNRSSLVSKSNSHFASSSFPFGVSQGFVLGTLFFNPLYFNSQELFYTFIFMLMTYIFI